MSLDAAALTLLAKSEARRQGFALAGIAAPQASSHIARYREWIAAGFHGEMDYLARQDAIRRRSDPRQILPECQAILVVAMRYPAPDMVGPEGMRVAAYARGQDYHDLLTARLRLVVEALESAADSAFPFRIYTDTGPLLERELAQRAGIGWIGKNTCLIHPEIGSYSLLAEVLLGLPLQPDSPFHEDRCGTCTRCLEACPTGCIQPDRTIDARRCRSYLTIELRGSLPVGLRPALGPWLFGCDVCQQVCPWNQKGKDAPTDPVFSPRLALRLPTPADILSLSPDAVRAQFRDSPLLRPKRAGLLRNAAVVAGNLGDRAALPALAEALDDPEPLVRGHAAWAIGQLAGPDARTVLQRAMDREADASVRGELGEALSRLDASGTAASRRDHWAG
jgi:epoxyqueuosine reductase